MLFESGVCGKQHTLFQVNQYDHGLRQPTSRSQLEYVLRHRLKTPTSRPVEWDVQERPK